MANISNLLYLSSLGASLLWFGSAFNFFVVQRAQAAKLLVPKSQRGSPIYPTLVEALPFLGGMNGAFALLCSLLIGIEYNSYQLFDAPGERFVILATLSSAHFSQFAGNVPIVLNGERKGDTYWPVLSGQMLMIFMMDLAQCLLAAVAAAAQAGKT